MGIARTIGCAVLLAGVAGAQEVAEERVFRVHGFLDATFERYSLPDGTLHSLWGTDDEWQFRVDHANVYFDFRPNRWLASLVEVRFLMSPYNEAAIPAMNTKVTFVPMNMTSDSVTPGLPPPDHSIPDAATGSQIEWRGVTVERAYLDILFHQHFGLRVGRFLTPVGIWNVDHGSPVILTVMQPYMVSMVSMFPKSQMGMMGRGTAFLGATDLEYSLYFSTGRNWMELRDIKDLGVGFNTRASWDVLGGIALGGSVFTGKIHDETMWVTQVLEIDALANTPIDDQFGTEFADPANRTISYTYDVKAREIDVGLDLEVKPIRNLSLQAEANFQQLRNELAPEKKSRTETFGWYALASYKFRLGDKCSLSPYFLFERIKSWDYSKNPSSYFYTNPDWGSEVFDAFSNSVVGVNLNLFTYAFLKIEYSHIDAHEKGYFEDFEAVLDMDYYRAQFSIAF